MTESFVAEHHYTKTMTFPETTFGTQPRQGGIADEDFSVERDINPLKQQFFQSIMSRRDVSPVVAAQLSRQFSGAMDAAADRIQKQRATDLQFEFASFQLDQAREKAFNEREMIGQLAPLQQQLDEVVNSGADQATRQRMLSQIGVQNAALFTRNPAASFAYDAARRGVGADEREPRVRLTAATYLSRGGSLDFLRDWAGEQGLDLEEDTAIPFSIYAKGMESAAEAKATETQSYRQSEEERKAQAKLAEERVKVLSANLDRATMGADPRTGQEIPDQFADPQTSFFIDQAISMFGTPEERSSAQALPPKDRLQLARKITNEVRLGQRKPAPAEGASFNLGSLLD